MPAKDLFHDAVKIGLEKDGWTITDDPLKVQFGDKTDGFIDLAAEKLLAAELGERKIAVEIKSFVGRSWVEDFHQALGQFLNYRRALRRQEPERQLFLAVPLETYENYFSRWLAQSAMAEHQLKLIVYDARMEVVVKWLE
jgi:hypothetical protein